MATVHWIQPGPLDKRTGGFVYNRRVITGLRDKGLDVVLHELSERYPNPSASDRGHAALLLVDLPDNSLVIVDGLAFAVLAEEMAPHAHRLRLVELCHHPLALETGMSEETARTLFNAEKSALMFAKAVITTSLATVRDLEPFAVAPRTPVTAVLPGVDVSSLAKGSNGPAVHMACVASLTRRKGHRFLIDALGGLRELDWHLTCAGGGQHEPDTADAITEQVKALGLEERITLVGELAGDALSNVYADADLFVLPSLHEGYGMVLVEALARGLPIISTTAGAIPDVVPSDAGILVAPGDSGALAAALSRLLLDKAERLMLAEGAKRARENLRPWTATVEEFGSAIHAVGGQ